MADNGLIYMMKSIGPRNKPCDMFVPVVYLRRKTCIIFQLFSFFLQYFNSIYIIINEFCLDVCIYIYIYVAKYETK